MKKSIAILSLLILLPTVTYAGWWTDLFGKKVLNNTTSQKNVNTNTTTTTIGDTKNTIEGDKNTVNIPDEQKSYILNFKDLDTIFGEKLSEANKTASQGVLYLGKSNDIINKASNDNVKQSKENTDIISKNLTEIKEIQGGILKLGTDYPGIQTTVNLPTQTQTLLETLNANIVTPLVNLGAKIESLTNQSLSNNNALISAINNMSSIPSSGGSGTTLVSSAITQTSHGLVAFNWVYLTTGGLYTKAINTTGATSDTIGMVTTVTDANTIKVTLDGYVTGMSGNIVGARYYLSGTTAGAMTTTVPITGIVRPIFIADTATSGYIQQYTSGESLPGTIAQVFASSTLTPSAAQTTAGTSALIPGMTTTLTPNGTTRYLVMTSVRARTVTTASNNSVDGGIQAALFDSAAPTVAIANSEVLPVYNANANTITLNTITQQIQSTSGSSYVLTISSPMTLQVRAWNTAAATTGTVMADSNGRTSMTIIQLDSKLPVSGQSVEYVNITTGAIQTVTGNATVNTASAAVTFLTPTISGDIPVNTTTGKITLTAGNTYTLSAKTPSLTNGIVFQWVNSTLGTFIGERWDASVGSAGINGNSPTVVITPEVTTEVYVQATFNSTTALGVSDANGTRGVSVHVQQIGTSAATTQQTRTMVRVRNPSNQAVTSTVNTNIILNNKIFDTTNAWNTSTSTFTSQRSAYYQVNWSGYVILQGGTIGQNHEIRITKNGVIYNRGITSENVQVASQEIGFGFSDVVQLNVGDTLQVQAFLVGTSPQLSMSGDYGSLSITELDTKTSN